METRINFCISLPKPLRAASAGRTLAASRTFTGISEDATMSKVKQASTQKRTSKAAAARVLGTAGLGFSLASSGSAATVPTADVPQSDSASPSQRLVLGEEEMADVSLATFYLF